MLPGSRARSVRRWIATGTVCFLALGLLEARASARGSSAQEETPSAKTKQKKSKKPKGQDENQEAPAESDAESAPEKHPSVTLGGLKLEFTARIEGDLRGATPAIGLDAADPEWQDRRVGLRGKAFKRIDFEVSRELGDDFEAAHDLSVKTPWRDIYADVKVTKWFSVEAGRFKLPFGHEELTGETNRNFTYRSLATRVLSPGRDPGVMVHGRLFKRVLEYQAGYFTQDGVNLRTSQTQGGQDAAVARIAVRPFAALAIPALAALEAGAAVADSRVDNRLGIRGRTVLGDQIFFDRVFVNGRRKRVGWEAAWAFGPVSMSSEYITASDERKGMDFGGADLPNVNADAWYLAGSWTLTGEPKHGWVEPRRQFPGRGFGAIEVAARVEALRFDAVTFPTTPFGFPEPNTLAGNADRVLTFGVNWYLNHWVRFQTNVIRESVDDPERSPAPSAGGRFISSVFRVQVRL